MRRTTWITVGAAGLVAAGVLIAVGAHRHDSPDPENAKPPPLGPHKADVQRIVASHGNPFGETAGIKVPGGGVGFSILTNDLVKPKLGPHEAQLGLHPDAEHSDWHVVKAGDVVTEYGVRVKVLRIWRMPNPENDAMDVQADPLPTPIVPIPSTPATASPAAS